MITLCKTCGTAYYARPDRCPICGDERQYVPATGQAWTDLDTVTATQSAVVLENLIGQFLYGKAEEGAGSGAASNKK